MGRVPISRVGRLPGFAYKGRSTYALTLRTFARRARFSDPRVVAQTHRIFRDRARESGFQFLAYCYMPDHLHLVIRGIDDGADLLACVSSARRQSGVWHAQRFVMALWQPGWLDDVVRDDASVERFVSHALANPVRAGFVDRWEDWPYSGTTLAFAGGSAAGDRLGRPPR